MLFVQKLISMSQFWTSCEIIFYCTVCKRFLVDNLESVASCVIWKSINAIWRQNLKKIKYYFDLFNEIFVTYICCFWLKEITLTFSYYLISEYVLEKKSTVLQIRVMHDTNRNLNDKYCDFRRDTKYLECLIFSFMKYRTFQQLRTES